jgi:hypothetical protein
MNLEGDELKKVTVNLDDRLTKEDPLSLLLAPLQQLIKIPDIGGLLNSFGNFLPQNLTQIDAEGIVSLLSPEALKQAISEGAESIKSLLEDAIKQKLDEVMSLTNEVTDTVENTAQSLISAGASITSLNLNFLNKTIDSFLQTFNITGPDLTSITSVQSTANSIINSLSNLSPKEIRDLFNPAYYQQVFDETLEAAINAVGQDAVNNALQQVAPSLNISSLNKLAQAGVGLFAAGAGGSAAGPYEMLVEVHTYHGRGDGADADAAQKKSVSGQALQSGRSCGVDNSTILIGSTVQTSLGTFKAVDKTKIASTTGLPVINLYYETADEAAMKTYELSSSKKSKQIVKVTPPGGGFTPKNLDKRGLDYDLY